MDHRRSSEDSISVLLARDIMRHDPWSIHAAATITQAARFLTSKNIGAAPVINDAGRPLGVVSRSDLVKKVRVGDNELNVLSSVKVYDVMTPSLLLVKGDTPVAKVIDTLLQHNVRRVFVADDDGVLVGVVSTTDIMTSFDQTSERFPNCGPARLHRRLCCVPSCGTRPSE
jgi:CBS domain-containing protein